MNFKMALLLIFCSGALMACGVRGRPQPPLEPTEIGRGKPSFKRVTEEYAFPDVPSPEATPKPRPPRKPRPGRN